MKKQDYLKRCDGCERDIHFYAIVEYENGKNYCLICDMKRDKKMECCKKKSELQKMLDASINTPPITLAQLKEELKKERDRKRGSK